MKAAVHVHPEPQTSIYGSFSAVVSEFCWTRTAGPFWTEVVLLQQLKCPGCCLLRYCPSERGPPRPAPWRRFSAVFHPCCGLNQIIWSSADNLVLVGFSGSWNVFSLLDPEEQIQNLHPDFMKTLPAELSCCSIHEMFYFYTEMKIQCLNRFWLNSVDFKSAGSRKPPCVPALPCDGPLTRPACSPPLTQWLLERHQLSSTLPLMEAVWTAAAQLQIQHWVWIQNNH